MRLLKAMATVAVASLALAGCGSGATNGVVHTAAPGATAAPTSATVTQAPVVTLGPAATPAPPAGGATLAPADSAAKLCGLVNAADLKTATGADYGAGVPDQYGLCTFRVGGAKVNSGDGQVVLAIQYEALSFVKQSFSGGTELTAGPDAAYWNGQSGLQSLWVDIGGGALLVLSFDPVTNDSQAAAQALASVIVGKL